MKELEKVLKAIQEVSINARNAGVEIGDFLQKLLKDIQEYDEEINIFTDAAQYLMRNGIIDTEISPEESLNKIQDMLDDDTLMINEDGKIRLKC